MASNAPAAIDVDSIIEKLLAARGRPDQLVHLAVEEVQGLVSRCKEVFLSQPVLLDLDTPLHICGNINGQYSSLLRYFELGGFPPLSSYLFLGNYVDHGKQGLETLCLLLAYKVKYPETVYLLRGNHECAYINRIYGFYDECKRRYNIKVWKAFSECFNCMPLAALVDGKVFCVHGGLSPDLSDLEDIRRIMRPTEVPDSGLMCDLLWAVPDPDVRGWRDYPKDVSLGFGADVVTTFLEKHDLDMICRSYQIVKDGYELFADGQLVTLYSAINNREMDNKGGMMSVDEALKCTFHVLEPVAHRRQADAEREELSS